MKNIIYISIGGVLLTALGYGVYKLLKTPKDENTAVKKLQIEKNVKLVQKIPGTGIVAGTFTQGTNRG